MRQRAATSIAVAVISVAVAAQGQEAHPAGGFDEQLGRKRFESYCAACHQREGAGLPGVVPPLTRSPWVAGPETRLIRIVLHGLRGPIKIHGTVYNMEMPGFSPFPDDEIAATLSFVRKHYGKPSPPISAATVRRVREMTKKHIGYWTVDQLLRVP